MFLRLIHVPGYGFNRLTEVAEARRIELKLLAGGYGMVVINHHASQDYG